MPNVAKNPKNNFSRTGLWCILFGAQCS